MRHAGITALAGALIWGVVAAAAAQSVPLPVPAPQPKTGSLPQGSAQPSSDSTGGMSASGSGHVTIGPFSIPDLLGLDKKPDAASRPGATSAFDASQQALANRVSNYLSSVQTLVGNFVQVGPDGRRTEGKFSIQKPGRVRFEYAPPSPIDVIADGQSVVVRDRKLATQDLFPLSQTPLRFLLADRIDLLRDTNLVGVSADDVFVTVTIEEKQALIGTHRLMLMFGAKDLQLRQWTVTDPQGYDTTVAVYNLDTSKRPDPNLFKINYERMLQ
jgi:outer membrane lipoprotein-sorting protein